MFRYDVEQLKSAASGRWASILMEAGCPEGVLDGRHHPCPRCGGTDRFRLLNADSGSLFCNACFSEKNGDGLSAVQWLRGCSFPDALGFVAERCGLNGNGRHDDRNIVERVAESKRVPAEALKQFGAIPAKRGPHDVCRLPVFGANADRCGWFDVGLDGGDKLRKGLLGKGDAHGLFLVDGHVPSGTVILVEGVKDAAALIELGHQAVGLPTRKLAARFASMFRDRNVVILPDRDEPGESGARSTAAVLSGLAASVRIATLPAELKPTDGDDVRDVLARPGGENLVRAAIDQAAPWRPAGSSVTNGDVVRTDDGETIRTPKSMPVIIDDIRAATDDWPRRVGAALFVHDRDDISWLENAAALTGFIGSKSGNPPTFHRGPDFHAPAEVYAEVRRTAPEYAHVETLPHEPKVPRVYYACDFPSSGDGSTLRELVDRFNPETDIDRDLILAAFVSPFWGGSGDRPAFVVTSDDGRGSGKTTFAKLVGRLAGGRVEIAADEPVEVIKQRLLSPDGITKRVAVVDNLKAMRFSSAGLEALITADVISGKRMYVGEAQRPNNLTWIVTLNGVSFATDMAQRSIAIKLKRPTYSGSWKDETEAFIDEHHAALVADCIGFLRSEAVELTEFTRWANWERDVLARLPEPSDAQAVIRERQRTSDAESDESDELEDYIANELRAVHYAPDADRVFIPSKLMREWWNAVTGSRDGVSKVSRAVKIRVHEGSLPRLAENNCRTWGRGFVWIGTDADEETVRTDLESRLAGKGQWDA